MSPARGAEAGFTLLELVVALVILGLAVAVAAPRIGRRGSEAEAAARALATALDEARGAAIDAARIVSVAPDELAARLPAGLRLALDGPAPLRFFPDGTASGGTLELVGQGRRARLRIEPLTGRSVFSDG